jgi:ribosome maturation factor RimP
MPPDTAGGSAAQTRERLLGLLGPVVSAAGYDLEDISVTAAGRRSLVRVSVDADGGVDLDAVAEVSRVVAEAIDETESAGPGGAAFAGPYVLEVSSPGVDRPLTEERHWRRAVGRLVQVKVGEHPVTGRVLETSGSAVTLDVAGSRREVPWSELGRGTVQVEFNRPSENGQEG